MSDLTLNLENYLPYRLATASNAVSSRIAEEYQQRFGLKIPQWRLMAVLGEGRPLTQRNLVAITRMDKVTVNRAAKSLAERDIIARQAHEMDGRSHHLALTDAGWSLYHQIVPIALAAEARIHADLSAEEREMMMRILAKLMKVSEPEWGKVSA